MPATTPEVGPRLARAVLVALLRRLGPAAVPRVMLVRSLVPRPRRVLCVLLDCTRVAVPRRVGHVLLGRTVQRPVLGAAVDVQLARTRRQAPHRAQHALLEHGLRPHRHLAQTVWLALIRRGWVRRAVRCVFNVLQDHGRHWGPVHVHHVALDSSRLLLVRRRDLRAVDVVLVHGLLLDRRHARTVLLERIRRPCRPQVYLCAVHVLRGRIRRVGRRRVRCALLGFIR